MDKTISDWLAVAIMSVGAVVTLVAGVLVIHVGKPLAAIPCFVLSPLNLYVALVFLNRRRKRKRGD